jgi:hypothetical protein
MGATILVVEIPFEPWSNFTISIGIDKRWPRPRPRHADAVPSIGSTRPSSTASNDPTGIR